MQMIRERRRNAAKSWQYLRSVDVEKRAIARAHLVAVDSPIRARARAALNRIHSTSFIGARSSKLIIMELHNYLRD